ncbi:quinone oxidoreductase-like [Tachypleus tridentatus]|uniref:quinone oxidoreductase-like n=1 Tax=Tachypleus tridentatus TaxID=6853 RepID=UPI003FD63373
MARLMRAVRVREFGGPKVLKVENDVPVPSISRTELLVKVKAAGVNPVDTYIREGNFIKLPNLPYIPGRDGAGVVEAVGEDVTSFKVGQRVYFCTLKSTSQCGSYAEYTAVDNKLTFPLVDNLSFEEGAAIGIPYFTAYRALILKAGAVPGETVLIHGASGAVGIAATQLARTKNMKIIGTAGTQEGLNVVKEAGAHHVCCHRDKKYLQNIMEATENKGVDVILEMLANVNLEKDLSMLAPRGRVIIIGNRGTVNINPRDVMGPETSIIGVALLSTTEEEWNTITEEVLHGTEEGWVKPIVDKRYTLDSVVAAHHDIIHSKGAKGKLVLQID